jgi:hypothetical protein
MWRCRFPAAKPSGQETPAAYGGFAGGEMKFKFQPIELNRIRAQSEDSPDG